MKLINQTCWIHDNKQWKGRSYHRTKQSVGGASRFCGVGGASRFCVFSYMIVRLYPVYLAHASILGKCIIYSNLCEVSTMSGMYLWKLHVEWFSPSGQAKILDLLKKENTELLHTDGTVSLNNFHFTNPSINTQSRYDNVSVYKWKESLHGQSTSWYHSEIISSRKWIIEFTPDRMLNYSYIIRKSWT